MKDIFSVDVDALRTEYIALRKKLIRAIEEEFDSFGCDSLNLHYFHFEWDVEMPLVLEYDNREEMWFEVTIDRLKRDMLAVGDRSKLCLDGDGYINNLHYQDISQLFTLYYALVDIREIIKAHPALDKSEFLA